MRILNEFKKFQKIHTKIGGRKHFTGRTKKFFFHNKHTYFNILTLFANREQNAQETVLKQGFLIVKGTTFNIHELLLIDYNRHMEKKYNLLFFICYSSANIKPF
jgi:hypothetical protein